MGLIGRPFAFPTPTPAPDKGRLDQSVFSADTVGIGVGIGVGIVITSFDLILKRSSDKKTYFVFGYIFILSIS